QPTCRCKTGDRTEHEDCCRCECSTCDEGATMARYDFDLITLGAGSGGVRASRLAASLGAKVAVFEERYLGGTCVNVGCIPKKLLVYGAHFSEDFVDAKNYGWTVPEPSFDWRTLIANKDKEITRLNGIY